MKGDVLGSAFHLPPGDNASLKCGEGKLKLDFISCGCAMPNARFPELCVNSMQICPQAFLWPHAEALSSSF